MLRCRTRVTAGEKALVETIQQMGYGEIFAPRVPDGLREYEIEASGSVLDLLETIRSGSPVSIITVHGGEPVFAEIDQSVRGFRCRKKVKYPTGSPEG